MNHNEFVNAWQQRHVCFAVNHSWASVLLMGRGIRIGEAEGYGVHLYADTGGPGLLPANLSNRLFRKDLTSSLTPRSVLSLSDENGKERVELLTDKDGSMLKMVDENAEPIWSAP